MLKFCGKITFTMVSVLVLASACRHAAISSESTGPERVKLTTLLKDTFSLAVHTSGILVPTEEMKLSFKTGGLVEKVYVREGDKVKKGDILASLDLLEIKANEEQAQIAYEKALRDFKRADTLLDQGALSLEKKQNAETALNITRQTLDIAKFNLSHSRIEAPDDGIIMKQFAKESELVSSGYPVFLFGSSGRYWKIECGLTDRDIIKVNPGDSAEIFFDTYLGVKFRAVVDQVGEMSNPYTGTYKAELLLKNPEYRLVSGFLATIEIFPSAGKAYIMVPLESLVESDGLSGYLYTINGSLKAEKRRVGIKAFRGTMVAVTGIPDTVSRVVCEGAAYLRDGDSVVVVR
jgi:multidrug efflux system membrane fusion protein